MSGSGEFASSNAVFERMKDDSWQFFYEFRPLLRREERKLLTVAVEECVTENSYDGDARKIKRLRWRIVGPWRLANDPFLLAPNDMSNKKS